MILSTIVSLLRGNLVTLLIFVAVFTLIALFIRPVLPKKLFPRLNIIAFFGLELLAIFLWIGVIIIETLPYPVALLFAGIGILESIAFLVAMFFTPLRQRAYDYLWVPAFLFANRKRATLVALLLPLGIALLLFPIITLIYALPAS